MDVSIQTASREHLTGIHELVLQWGYQASEHQTLEWLDALNNSANNQLFVALSGDLVVGWAAVEKRITLGRGHIAEITGLVVRAGFRRSGVGKVLVSAAEQWSRALELPRVVVRSNVTRAEAHQFYPSVGFELTKTTNVYEKDLSNPADATSPSA
ncbi:GNAT family N-acetyltransferase [Marinobacter sp. F4216]|uniref:GNAT family N-acetyltransferase n=1 Tax=Marinobacter sp. F4216 TaxID=2874281 RepID=UPI001CBA7917|nr:GNAT family N-acetyltransferase [Marinobacter sp. F4216]MBZ2169747.1 GNAT family N-acetyltransferase [Marinobacter sp. F4216]